MINFEATVHFLIFTRLTKSVAWWTTKAHDRNWVPSHLLSLCRSQSLNTRLFLNRIFFLVIERILKLRNAQDLPKPPPSLHAQEAVILRDYKKDLLL